MNEFLKLKYNKVRELVDSGWSFALACAMVNLDYDKTRQACYTNEVLKDALITHLKRSNKAYALKRFMDRAKHAQDVLEHQQRQAYKHG